MPDFETLYTPFEVKMLQDAYDAITWCEMWDWLREYTPAEGMGFMFSSHPNLDRINGEMKLFDDHSGSSYGWTMRQMESIAKRGWEGHKNEVRWNRAVRKLQEWAQTQRKRPHGHPCPCRVAKGYTFGWCGVAGGGVPGCEH